MIIGGDASAEGSGGGSFDFGAFAGAFGGAALGSTLGGSGKAGMRSALQGIARAQQFQLLAQRRAAVFDAASRAAVGKFEAFEHPVLVTQPGIDAKTIQFAKTIGRLTETVAKVVGQVQGAKNAKKLAKQQAKLAAVQGKKAAREALLPPSMATWVAQYGIASGLPVIGSRDDPNGIMIPRVTTSLLGG